MVSFPPLAPSVEWFSNFLKAASLGHSEEEAIKNANSKLKSYKDFGRYSLQSQHGETLILSLAVEGGGKQLRSRDRLPELLLSEHGNWRKVHSRAWEAILGRKPYFRYLEPLMNGAYEDLRIVKLEEFNKAIFKSLLSFLLGSMKFQEVSQFRNEGKWIERGKEIALAIDPELSLLQALSDHGRETILGIMASDYK